MDDLILLLIIPLAGALAVFSLSIFSSRMLKGFSFMLSLIPLIWLCIENIHWIGADYNHVWLPSLAIFLHLHVDGISLIFLFLSSLIIPLTILSVDGRKLSHPNVFFGLILLLQSFMIGFFTARDLAFFILFFESMLIPLYFIISIWGGSGRQTAALVFLVYMIAGSCLLIAAALFLYTAQGSQTFNLDELAKVSQSLPHATWIAAIFALAFAVKTPLFPFHAWLPETYYQASTPGTILLSALLSKAGIYGFIRIGFELFPEILKTWSPLLLGLAVAGVLYGGLAAWMQNDYKKLLAYSSFSHVNFVLAGLFIWSEVAHQGAILQAFNHGITIAALFLVSGWLEERILTTRIGHIGGLAKFLPHLCWLTCFFVLSSIAVPGTNNFIGELMIFFGLFGLHPWLTAILGLSIILSVMYMLRWMQKLYFEAPTFFQDPWKDIRWKEFLIASPLVALILWVGLYPLPFLNILKTESKQIAAVNIKESDRDDTLKFH